MRNRVIIFLSALWVMGAIAGFAVETGENPADAPKEHMRRMGAKRGGLGSELGLSKEKRAQMKEKMHETRKLMIRLKAERDEAKAELQHLMDSDSVDKKTVLAAADKLARVSGAIIKARVRSRLNMISMLTPEQREKMKGFRKRMHQRRQGRKEKWKENRPGRQWDDDKQRRRQPWQQQRDTEPHPPVFEPEEPF